MAFIYKNKNSKFWIAAFRDISGKRCNRSTKLVGSAENRRQAEKIADEYERVGNSARTSQQVRRTIGELHKSLTGKDLPLVTVRAHVEQWLESKKTSVAPATFVFYKAATAKFVGYLEKRADACLSDITREDIQRFRDSMVSRLSSTTVNHHVKALRMLFTDARDRSLLVDDPTEFVKTVKAKKVANRRPFTIEEVQKIIVCCDAEWRSMVLFGLYTGQRLGDIAKLRWESLDLGKQTFSIHTSKTAKRLNVPLHPNLLEHLQTLPAPIDRSMPVHPEAAALVQKHERSSPLSNEFGRILASAGLRDKRPHRALGEGRDGKRKLNDLSFHSLRRTATTLLHEAGVPQAVAMALIGHDSEDIHAIYVNVGEDALRQASGKLPSLRL